MAKYFLVFLLFGQFAFAQQNLTLSKSQMYADFDTLAQSIIKISPQIPIKKDLWHYDVVAEINKKRKLIDTISSDLSFYILLQKVMNTNLDMHTSNNSEQKGLAETQLRNYSEIRNKFKFSLGNSYINGKYIITTPFIVSGDTINIGSEITHFNKQKVDDYVATHLDSRWGFKYDLKYKKFYFTGFFKNVETVFLDTLYIGFKNTNGIVKQYRMPTNSITKFLKSSSLNKNDSTRVEYWNNENILFIRVTEMKEEYIPFFKYELNKYRNKVAGIKKVIIDFRGNGGGADTTWSSLYAELIDKTISFHQKIDDLNQSTITDNDYVARGLNSAKRIKDYSLLLNKYNFYIVSDKVQTLEPSNTSIKFKGKIYVLTEDHFSSTGSAISVANSSMTDNLITVGRKTDYFLGIGFSPINFHLPFSQLSYRVAPSIEVTNAKNLIDLMQDKIQIEIPYNLNDYKNRFNYIGDISSKEFLLQYDPFVKKVLEQ
jgi:Peptidase family S41